VTGVHSCEEVEKWKSGKSGRSGSLEVKEEVGK
jgi:hypothetical protein